MISKLDFQQKILMRKSDIEIYSLNVILLLYLFRPAIPLFKYPFILLYICYFCYVILVYKNGILDCLKEFFNKFLLILILVGVLYLAIYFSSKLYLSILKEAIDVLILLSLFFVLTMVISSKSKLVFFVSNLLSLILIFSSFIAIINTQVFIELQIYSGFYLIHNYQNRDIINLLLLDVNFALLPIFFGFIIILYKMNSSISKIKHIIFNFVLLLFSINILLSSSRRGLLVLLLIVFILFLLLFFNCLFKTRGLIVKNMVSNLRIFYLAVVIIPLIIIIFFHYGSYNFKVNTLKLMGAKDITTTKRIITSTIFSDLLRFSRDLSYSDLNKALWSTSFDPKDPDNGWGSGTYKTIFPIKGKNCEIVPKDSKGYFLDHSCSFSSSNSYAYSNTFIGNSKVNEHEIVRASVYCFVSSDFNGDIVCLRADGATFGDRVSQYDFKSKGIWQMLSLSAGCNNGDAPVALYFNKQGVTNFFSLTGFVIFAYPQYQIVNIEDTVLARVNLYRRSQSEKRLIGYQKPDYSQIKNVLVNRQEMPFKFSTENSNINIDQKNKSIIQIPVLVLTHFPLNEANLIPHLVNYSTMTDTINLDSDIFRNWIKSKFREDTTYYENKTKLKVDTLSKFFVDDRISRWQFALQIFTKEFNWPKKIFGDGFNFLNWYGYYFYGDKKRSDYPHNPFLHILLYSGIVGLFFYLLTLYKVFYYYIKYINDYYLFFIFFLITFFFTFFSGGNPFDPPIMGFFVMLPFFIHSIYKKETGESVKVTNTKTNSVKS